MITNKWKKVVDIPTGTLVWTLDVSEKQVKDVIISKEEGKGNTLDSILVGYQTSPSASYAKEATVKVA